jgi:hypothetical protein
MSQEWEVDLVISLVRKIPLRVVPSSMKASVKKSICRLPMVSNLTTAV